MKGKHLASIRLKGEFVDLNTYIQAERSNRFVGAKIKQEETDRVIYETKKFHDLIKQPVWIRFDWYTRDMRKDADNISFSKKFILDGLVKAKVIKNDTRKFVVGFEDHFHVDEEFVGVDVRFFEVL